MMMGSSSGRGNRPVGAAHSISKERMRNGAIFIHSPSGLWKMILLKLGGVRGGWRSEKRERKEGGRREGGNKEVCREIEGKYK